MVETYLEAVRWDSFGMTYKKNEKDLMGWEKWLDSILMVFFNLNDFMILNPTSV